MLPTARVVSTINNNGVQNVNAPDFQVVQAQEVVVTSPDGISSPTISGPGPVTLYGWYGYNSRFNATFVIDGSDKLNGRPVYRHSTQDWCRLYWAHGYWKIGHTSWVHGDNAICIAGVKSDALLPAQISSPAMWYEHKGTKPGHDFSKNPKDFKEAGMVTIVADPAYTNSISEGVGESSHRPPGLNVSGAGSLEVNGSYVFVPGEHPNRIFGTIAGHYRHTANPAIFIGFQDCRSMGHPEWNKWVIFTEKGVRYAAHTGGQIGVPPRNGRWETVHKWPSGVQEAGNHPAPMVNHSSEGYTLSSSSDNPPPSLRITHTNMWGGAFNDTWNRSGDFNGRPRYSRRGNPRDFIQWDGSRWVLCGTCPGKDQPAYVNGSQSMIPPLEDWYCEQGSGPAPVLKYMSGPEADASHLIWGLYDAIEKQDDPRALKIIASAPGNVNKALDKKRDGDQNGICGAVCCAMVCWPLYAILSLPIALGPLGRGRNHGCHWYFKFWFGLVIAWVGYLQLVKFGDGHINGFLYIYGVTIYTWTNYIMNFNRETPLNKAAEQGQTEVIRQLIAKGADVNLKAAGGTSALHIAAANGHSEIVDILLAAGADPNASTKCCGTECTPYFCAACCCSPKTIRPEMKKGRRGFNMCLALTIFYFLLLMAFDVPIEVQKVDRGKSCRIDVPSSRNGRDKCLEDGKRDPQNDCCTLKGSGSCADGWYLTELYNQCGNVYRLPGAVLTEICCSPPESWYNKTENR